VEVFLDRQPSGQLFQWLTVAGRDVSNVVGHLRVSERCEAIPHSHAQAYWWIYHAQDGFFLLLNRVDL
jgi:hypothetical protein